MPYEQDVKELAYTIDPPCWVSYSGKGRNFKAAMDWRREKSLREAQEQIDRVKERRMGRRHDSKGDVEFGFASFRDGTFELIVRDPHTGNEAVLSGPITPEKAVEVDKVLPTCLFVSGRPARN